MMTAYQTRERLFGSLLPVSIETYHIGGPSQRPSEASQPMPKLTRIYTRTGDDGTTGLVGGQRIKKNDLRIEAYGCVDELSSVIGVARAALADVQRTRPAQDVVRALNTAQRLDEWLAWTQDLLFNLGSELATLPADRSESMPLVGVSDTAALERAIDAAQADLEPLNKFILPGGSPCGATLHVARTVARRAERLLVTLAERDAISEEAIRFLNRLSDALFVWSRWINHALDLPEHQWNAQARPPG
jgi:cob(I)alamin adenosyltransferase